MSKVVSHFRRRLISYLIATSSLVLLAGGAFTAFESRQVSSLGEGLWWALALVSGGGFVSESPESISGRVLASILLVAGFGLMALVTAALASLFVHEEQGPEELAEGLFETKALTLLADLAQRLEAIEATVKPENGSPRGPADPPSATSP